MKVYRFFLNMSYKEMLNLQTKLCLTFEYRYISEENCLIHYAWTTSKKMKNEFIDQRSKVFIYDKTDIPDEDFNTFRLDFKNSMLTYEKMSHYDKTTKKKEEIEVLCTIDESNVIKEFSEEMIGAMIEKWCEPESDYIKEDYLDSLDMLLYTLYHGQYHSESEDYEDFVFYNRGYGLTPGGNPVDTVLENVDEFNLFIGVFKELFKEKK